MNTYKSIKCGKCLARVYNVKCVYTPNNFSRMEHQARLSLELTYEFTLSAQRKESFLAEISSCVKCLRVIDQDFWSYWRRKRGFVQFNSLHLKKKKKVK